MAVVRRSEVAGGGHRPVEVLDAAGTPVPVAGDFLAHLAARGCSPNTVLAYGSDLSHLWRFLGAAGLGWDALTPERAVELLIHLRATPARRRGQPRAPVLATCDGAPGLSPATVNRALAAVSSFYDWAMLAGRFGGPTIKSGDPVEQEKQLKYMNLVANAIMLSNVADLTDVVVDMAEHGHQVTPELVARLSPYSRQHIRRFGRYILDMDDLPEPLAPKALPFAA